MDKLYIWIFNHPHVVHLPLITDHINTKNDITGKVIKTQKLIIQSRNPA